ncbi:hypothetical protein ACVTNA_30025, partial [Escherichia coli]
MSVTIQGNTSTVISNNSAPEGTSEIAKITRQIQVLTEKLGKISSEEGMTTQPPVNKLYFLRRASPRGKQSEHQTINDTRNTIKD